MWVVVVEYETSEASVHGPFGTEAAAEIWRRNLVPDSYDAAFVTILQPVKGTFNG